MTGRIEREDVVLQEYREFVIDIALSAALQSCLWIPRGNDMVERRTS